METFTVESLKFSYPNREKAALCGVSLSIQEGEFLLLCGASGSGKTTFLRHLKPALTPSGFREGKIFYKGMDLEEVSFEKQSREIGFVLQDPENQIVTDTVEHELAFGLENLGMPPAKARLRIAEIVEFFGLQECFHQEISSLSGGKKQILNLAAVMAMQPSVLLLDEPTSMLDPVAALEFLQAVYRINRETGTTVILTEHRLEEVFPLADRVAVMEEGTVAFLGTPRQVGEWMFHSQNSLFRALPAPARLFAGKERKLPLTVREGRICLEKWRAELPSPQKAPKKEEEREELFRLKHLWFRYVKDIPDVLKDLSLSVEKGEIFCLLGGNGSGKTTLLSLIRGLEKPYSGKLEWRKGEDKKIPSMVLLPQNPRILFLHGTVWEDLLMMAPGKTRADREQNARQAAQQAGAQDVLQAHPYDLSGGECQKAGLSLLLLQEASLLLLDEPTKGLDARSKEELGILLRDQTRQGKTVFLVSHDVEFCAEYGDRCGLLFNGEIVSCGKPNVFFAENQYYTTAVSRMARGILPGAVTEKDVKEAWPGWDKEC